MITKNRLDKSFGPVGASTGIFILLGGCIAAYFSLAGIILILFGAFIGFTSTSSFLDPENKRMKFSNNLFGIISIGKWIDINPDMKIGLKNMHRGYRTYSRGNRTLDMHTRDIRIILYGGDNKKILTIGKYNSKESAKSDLEILSTHFGLQTV